MREKSTGHRAEIGGALRVLRWAWVAGGLKEAGQRKSRQGRDGTAAACFVGVCEEGRTRADGELGSQQIDRRRGLGRMKNRRRIERGTAKLGFAALVASGGEKQLGGGVN
ncbi:hypothetical protein M0R45_006827 [Rubus argutus]|uniref:Uncharacterized protein n=1 Tax=Rubus argutus TaxID=59490 RepID=A0AAW1YRN2_RUBAR